jgi:molybdenum cofactor guanylyltransferase
MSHAGAIVLAGGASSRMGRDKSWLELDGRPLLAHVLERLARRCSPILVSARADQRLPHLDGLELLRVDDPEPGGGPLVGLLAGLRALEQRGVARAYLSSCDALGVSEAHVDFMLARLHAESGLIAAVPIDADGRRHPLAAAVDVARMRARAEAQLDAGDRRLQALFSGDAIAAVPASELPDREVLVACNTPQEWAAALARREPRR